MLFLVATPIGNLSDITFRAIETLKDCDYILCEDTRHSSHLLKHYQINKQLKSFHKFSEAKQQDTILNDLKDGLKIALISDAGTPGIADPGERLVQACRENGIEVVSIPGPCAAIAAITCSGLPTGTFQFVGFLPKKESELKSKLSDLLEYTGTTICYESPKRIRDVLEIIHELDSQREVVIARELTKKFEEVVKGVSSDVVKKLSETVKGEIVLLIAPKCENSDQDWNDLSIEKHVEIVQQTHSLTKKQAIKLVSSMRGQSKRDIYQTLIRDS